MDTLGGKGLIFNCGIKENVNTKQIVIIELKNQNLKRIHINFLILYVHHCTLEGKLIFFVCNKYNRIKLQYRNKYKCPFNLIKLVSVEIYIE